MRYVIKSASGNYFTEFEVIQSRSITLNGVFVGIENDCKPKFEAALPRLAAKFDSEQDAVAQIENTLMFHGGPEAFAGCTVESTNE